MIQKHRERETQRGREANLDSSASAFADSIWHSCSWRIYHRHETNKTEPRDGEVGAIGVKLKAWGELFRVEVVVAES